MVKMLSLLSVSLLAVEVEAAKKCIPLPQKMKEKKVREDLKCANPEKEPTDCACIAHKEPEVDCSSANPTGGHTHAAGAKCIKVQADKDATWAKHDFYYPTAFGSTCKAGVLEVGSYDCTKVKDGDKKDADGKQKYKTNPFKKDEDGYNNAANTETWCTDEFCWVDPCTCNKADITKSTWMTNQYYSYSQCGAEDKYTPAACSDHTTETKCKEYKSCQWGEADADSGAPLSQSLSVGFMALMALSVDSTCRA